MTDLAIAAVLAELGFHSAAERRAARQALEEAGLTRPHKQAISSEKLPRIRALLDARFAFTCEPCHSAVARGKPGAEVLRVDDGRCERCGGSDHRAAALRFAEACEKHSVERIVVVGGSPSTRQAVRAHLANLDVECIDGTRAMTSQRARQLIDRADLVLVWGATQLHHSVSSQFDSPRDKRKVISTQRRGLASLLDDGARHLELRP